MTERTYNISLPDYTNKDIIDWFEERMQNNSLTHELVVLVHKALKETPVNKKPSTVMAQPVGMSRPNSPMIASQPQHQPQHMSSTNIFDQMYDWQASNNAIFQDEGVKKEKKRMLGI